jgi:hypothetical protein
MEQLPSQKIEMRSQQDVIDRCREIIHRARRKFIKKNSRPCPLNCVDANHHGNTVTGCNKCLSYNSELCMRPEEFQPIYTKEELASQFREELYDRKMLFRNHPAIAVLLWVLGVVKTEEDEIDRPAMENLEKKSKAAP